MNNYVDVEGINRAASRASSAADSMSGSASTIEKEARGIDQAAQMIHDAAERIAHLLESGYGGNGLRLIEFLEAGVKPTWRCFHCDETFDDAHKAALHFGTKLQHSPACQIDISAYRKMEKVMESYTEEDAQIHREMHKMASDHVQALQREEEKGYSRGLRDAVRYPDEVMTPADVWVIAQETVVDRGGPRKELGYTLLPGAECFATSEEASDAIGIAKFPLGWVYLKLSKIIPAITAPAGLEAAKAVAPIDVSALVNRFLCWKLPQTFAPDCGISFDRRKDDEWNKNKTWPIGTNLFTADEAKAMFLHCLAATAAAALPVVDDLETLMIQHRVGVTPEYDGPWHAFVFGEDEKADFNADGATPTEAVRAAIAASQGDRT